MPPLETKAWRSPPGMSAQRKAPTPYRVGKQQIKSTRTEGGRSEKHRKEGRESKDQKHQGSKDQEKVGDSSKIKRTEKEKVGTGEGRKVGEGMVHIYGEGSFEGSGFAPCWLGITFDLLRSPGLSRSPRRPDSIPAPRSAPTNRQHHPEPALPTAPAGPPTFHLPPGPPSIP